MKFKSVFLMVLLVVLAVNVWGQQTPAQKLIRFRSVARACTTEYDSFRNNIETMRQVDFLITLARLGAYRMFVLNLAMELLEMPSSTFSQEDRDYIRDTGNYVHSMGEIWFRYFDALDNSDQNFVGEFAMEYMKELERGVATLR